MIDGAFPVYVLSVEMSSGSRSCPGWGRWLEYSSPLKLTSPAPNMSSQVNPPTNLKILRTWFGVLGQTRIKLLCTVLPRFYHCCWHLYNFVYFASCNLSPQITCSVMMTGWRAGELHSSSTWSRTGHLWMEVSLFFHSCTPVSSLEIH